MKTHLAILATIAAALTTACEPPPEFVASLSDPGSAEYDQRVLGQWYWFGGNEIIYALVEGDQRTRSSSSGTELEISFFYGRGVNGQLWRFTAFPSQVDDVLYYNLVRIQSPNTTDYTALGEEPGHIIVRPFHPTPDTMLVCVLFWTPSEDALKGTLKGTGLTPRFATVPPRVNGRPADPDDEGGPLHTLVDGSREDLLRLVRRDPGSDFEVAFLFTRLGNPSPDPSQDPELVAWILLHKDECRFQS